MKRKLIHYVASHIHNLGIPISALESKQYYLQKTGILLLAAFNYSLIIIFAGFYAIKNRDDFNKFINPIPHVAAVLIVLGSFFSIFLHKRPLGELLFQMDVNMYSYPEDDELPINYNKWYLREDKIILLLKTIRGFYFGSIFVRGFPTFVHFFYSGSIETFLYPALMPWPMKGRYWQLFILFFQLCQILCGIWCFNLVILSILTPVFEFFRQYKRLEVAVASLWSRTLMTSGGNKRQVQRIMHENIIHCIKHHQILCRNFQLYKLWMEMILSCNLLVCLLSLAFGMYIVVNASSFLKVYNCFEIIGLVSMDLLAMCILSEIFSNLNEGLTCTLFWEVDWYEMNEKNRRLLIIFHHMSKRPFQLWAFTIFPANRDVFSKILRATYSIFNVLNVSLKK